MVKPYSLYTKKVHYSDKGDIKEYNIHIILYSDNKKYECLHFPAISDPSKYRYGDLIYQGDTISFDGVNYVIGDKEWIQDWNMFIQRKMNFYVQYKPGDYLTLYGNNEYMYGYAYKEYIFYNYVWNPETKSLESGRIDRWCSGSNYDPEYYKFREHFIVAPIKSMITIFIGSNRIDIGLDIYSPINIITHPSSLSEFWRVHKSTIYKIGKQYSDISITH